MKPSIPAKNWRTRKSDRERSRTAAWPVKGVHCRSDDTLEVRPITASAEVHLAEVRLQEGESLENALRRFKRKVQTEDIIKDVKRHSFYLKPGEKKRVKQALARKRARKKARTNTDERR